MLISIEDTKYIALYLQKIDTDKRIYKLRVAPDSIPDKDKKKLLGLDEYFFVSKGYHMITDYEVLL